MVVTFHFVDSNWLLQKRILNFCNVPPSHSSVVIADALRESFTKWGILDKVFTIIDDNVSVNGSTIDILKDNFELSGSFLLEDFCFMLGVVLMSQICWCKQGLQK